MGPGDARCEGRSVDPPSTTLVPVVAQASGGTPAGYASLLGLALSWPQSATLRLRAAEVAPASPSALRLYTDAVRLHDEGCALAPAGLGAALHGRGTARLAVGASAGARDAVTRAVRTSPDAAPSHYALAATHCRLHAREACADTLLAALAADREGTLAALAARDPDLASVRDEARVAAALAGLDTPAAR